MILIIRPKSESKKIEEEFKKKNYQYHTESISHIRIKACKIKFDSNLIYLISSVQSVLFLKKNLSTHHDLISKGQFFVIGKKVESELKRLGAKKIKKVFLDSHNLIKFLKRDKNNFSLNHIRGSIENELLANFFKKFNNRYQSTIVYNVYFKKKLSVQYRKLMKNKKITIMIHYSLSAAQAFMKLVHASQKRHFQEKVHHYCLSKRIALGLRELKIKQGKINISSKPDHESMMWLLNHSIGA